LAYVEWFTPVVSGARNPHPCHGLYKVTRLLRSGTRLANIVPLSNIERSCHLLPDFGTSAPREWSSSDV
ncbi:hypothetical protein PYCCODRAFT_1344873, partial [Trametes coccinea BRFM310]